MSKHQRRPPSQGNYTGKAEGGGRPRAGEGHGGWDSPSGHGGTHRARAADSLRETAYFMEQPDMIRARGRLPKNYRRSDARVREDVCERLMMDDEINAGDVSVQVCDGVVVLEGSVPERAMHYRIEDIAASCPGVHEVENGIRAGRVDAAHG
jgi:hypothetical protein